MWYNFLTIDETFLVCLFLITEFSNAINITPIWNRISPTEIFFLYSICNILTSNPTELLNKKSTCANNRCIRSKISGDNLDCGRVELSADATLTEAGGCQKLYNPVLREVRVSWRSEFGVNACSSKQWEPDPAESWALRSPGWAAQENERDVLLWPEELGVNMLQFCSVSNLPITHIPFVTLSNKVRGIFF